MSDDKVEYEDYNETSKSYDGLRIAIDLASLLQTFEKVAKTLNKPVNELKLLDVGCGTGNYIAAIKDKVGSCTGLEYNDGMLVQSRAKFAEAKNVTLFQGTAENLTEFEENQFDIVIMTMVLHHLAPEANQKVFNGIQRVLQIGGAFWFSTSSPIQQMEGFWWAPIVPQGVALTASRFTGIPLLHAQLKEAGLDIADEHVSDETMIALDDYVDPQGPLNLQYRNCDSAWSRASPQELDAGLKWWQSMIDSDKAKEYIQERENIRARVGMSTTIVSVKK